MSHITKYLVDAKSIHTEKCNWYQQYMTLLNNMWFLFSNKCNVTWYKSLCTWNCPHTFEFTREI